MKKTICTIIIVAFTVSCFGQVTQTKYYNNERLQKEVPEKRAKFLQTITYNQNGSVTKEVKNLNTNEVVFSETFRGDEPFGTRKVNVGRGYVTIDYNFELSYSGENCKDSLQTSITDHFEDNDSLGYKAPKIASGEPDLMHYLLNSLYYPSRAREQAIQGTVYLQFTITADGTIEDIVIQRGVNILLDKEAARVFRDLKLSSPPTINGQAFTIKCVVLPIRFVLMS